MKVFGVASKPEEESSYLFLTHDYSFTVDSPENLKEVYQWLPASKTTIENLCKFSTARDARNYIHSFYPNIKHIHLFQIIEKGE